MGGVNWGWKLTKNELPEFKGGANWVEAAKNEVPEYKEPSLQTQKHQLWITKQPSSSKPQTKKQETKVTQIAPVTEAKLATLQHPVSKIQ